MRKGVLWFWKGVAIACALVLLSADIVDAPWLIGPTVAIVGLANAHHQRQRR